MKTRSFLLSFIATLPLISVAWHSASGTISGTSGYIGGGATPPTGFTPQSGFSFSGSTAPGGTMTITSTSSVFSTKPYGGGPPLVWAPMDADMNGSTLGRINGSSTWKVLGNLVWQSGCAPAGAGGCAYGGTTKGDGAVGGSPGSGTTYQAVAAIDLDEWSGWASQNGGAGYYFNDLGGQLYVWRKEEHVGFGHLDSSSGNSYNGQANYNYKNIRIFSRFGGGEVSPDIYWPVHNQRFEVESCFQSCASQGITSGAPIQHIDASTVGSPDVNGTVSVQQAFDGMTTGSGMFNQWQTNEFYFQTNTSSTASPYPPNSQFWFSVVGINSNQPIENWPVSNYQNSSPGVGWMFVDTGSLQSNGHGTMLRAYGIQAVVDGQSNCPNCADLPNGAYFNFGPTYIDDCICHVVVQDSATYNSATGREIQIPSSWAAGSITMTLRAGAFSNLHSRYLFVIDSGGTAHYVGQFTLLFEPHLMNAANDDSFEMKEVA